MWASDALLRRVELIAVGREVLRGRATLVAPILQTRWAGRYRLEIAVQTDVADESLLNPLFERIMASVAGSYLKADPKGFGREVQLVVYITGEGTSEEAAHTIVQQARRQLRDALEGLGYGLVAVE